MRLSSENIVGVILAGGRGLRMGGKDKGLALYKGQPLIHYAIDLLRPQVETIIIVANRNLSDYGCYGYPVIQDQIAGFQGPLMGIASALECVTNDLNVEAIQIMPCDMPRLPHDLVDRLNQSLTINQATAAFPVYNGKPQPVVCLLKTQVEVNLLKHFERIKNRSVIGFLKSIHHVQVDFSQYNGCFININT